ncbi:copper resistance CopC family protein [Microbacterium sp. C7(2022)]|uniref:copper resistance CopC family protein n=1 Tax=Microbacterium sp. C7(2022) TaxID=2992759 RepID=UPI00237A0CC9|nr:copper resistance CopC family protein [Microbacterium sp. C7(2022)]MDE0546727.1 copper resistance protein CopC [Microbacterium sp. C7(2022)]
MASTTRTRARTARPVVAVIIAALLAAASILFLSPSAHAHDELVGSEPTADATLDAAPEAIVLTFSGLISTEPGASEVQVTDAAGADVTAGDPEITDNVLTQPLSPDASGEIAVLWKVVSSDGHPISGEYAFEISAPEPSPTPSPSTEPTESPSAEPTPTAVESPSATPVAPAEGSSFGDVWPWVIGGIILAGLGGAVIYLLVSRARQNKALADSSSSTQR